MISALMQISPLLWKRDYCSCVAFTEVEERGMTARTRAGHFGREPCSLVESRVPARSRAPAKGKSRPFLETALCAPPRDEVVKSAQPRSRATCAASRTMKPRGSRQVRTAARFEDALRHARRRDWCALRPPSEFRETKMKNPRAGFRAAGLIIGSCDVGLMPVICPSRQVRRYHRPIG
jgi:hypothetical protein